MCLKAGALRVWPFSCSLLRTFTRRHFSLDFQPLGSIFVVQKKQQLLKRHSRHRIVKRSSRAAASLRGVIYLSVLFAGKSGSPLVSATRGSSGEERSNDVLFSAGSEPPASRLLQPSPSECAPEIRVKARAAGSFQTSASGKGGRLGLELAGPRKNSLFQVFLRDSGFIFFSIKRKENEANHSKWDWSKRLSDSCAKITKFA